jgi:hypothetical protein
MSFELVKIEIFSRIVPDYLKALSSTESKRKAQTVTFDFINKLTEHVMLLSNES